MDIRPNCSSECESGSCYIHPAVNGQQSLDILLRLCTLSTKVVEVQSRSLSPVLCAVVWTLLSCGILLSLVFLVFIMRYKNNRIVKMSSPNLNVLTLLGSILTYTSGFLFAMEERSSVHGAGPRAVLQMRVWTLCVGSTLVFGPILGKTWRLYRVFTQRVPDRRVIIRDIQLMGLVTLLIAVDVVLLTAWSITDPAKCSWSVSAIVKVVKFDVRYSMSQLDSCSSQYSDLWVILIFSFKGSLLLYGTYLAGLTSDVSLPPVNQSLTIMAAVCLVTTSTAVVVPISRYLYTWPNLVYSVMSGTIFICTVAINCLLFVPQLTQWRQFEEEVNPHPSQMAKYFSSPSKSLHSVYSEDEIYYLLGENDSMKRLISEKNAVIDSLQEQVNNAKDKLLKLMSVSHLQDEGDMDSSTTNLHSSSTQTTMVPPEVPPSPVVVRNPEASPPSSLSPPPYVAPPSLLSVPKSYQMNPESLASADSGHSPHVRASSPPTPAPPHPPLSSHSPDGASQNSQLSDVKLESALLTRITEESQPKANALVNSISNSQGLESSVVVNMTPNPSVSTPPSSILSCVPQGVTAGVAVESVAPSAVTGGARQGFVSSEQLQEILQDLSVDAVSGSIRTPAGARRPSNPAHDDLSALITFSPLSPLSPRSPQFHFPSISPYVMRKRRPPFHSSRTGLPSPYYYPGSVPPGCRRGSAPPGSERHRERDLAHDSSAANPSHRREACDDWRWGDEEKEQAEIEGVRLDSDARSRSARRGSRRVRRGSSSGRRGPGSPFSGETTSCGQSRAPDRNRGEEPYEYSDSESSSSEDYCYYHRPYCEGCRHTRFSSSESSSTSETSDSEFGELYHTSHPVVNFKEDLKPTFV